MTAPADFPYFPKIERDGSTLVMDQPDGSKIVLSKEYQLFIINRLCDANRAIVAANTLGAFKD